MRTKSTVYSNELMYIIRNTFAQDLVDVHCVSDVLRLISFSHSRGTFEARRGGLHVQYFKLKHTQKMLQKTDTTV